jgi:hypothetical protein
MTAMATNIPANTAKILLTIHQLLISGRASSVHFNKHSKPKNKKYLQQTIDRIQFFCTGKLRDSFQPFLFSLFHFFLTDAPVLRESRN